MNHPGVLSFRLGRLREIAGGIASEKPSTALRMGCDAHFRVLPPRFSGPPAPFSWPATTACPPSLTCTC